MVEYDRIVVHYDEIGLKGKNRHIFERLLVTNIKHKLGDFVSSIHRESGQLVVSLDKNAKIDEIKDILSKVPGAAFFSFAVKAELKLEAIKKSVLEFLKDQEFETFKIHTRRHNKNFEMKSMELNCLLGEVVMNGLNKKVKMKNPDRLVKVEISEKYAFISCENVKSVGGLPTNPKQKVVTLLSGGFDSPVASYMMMKRGCEVIFVHFNNKHQMSCSVKDKIVMLAKQLSKFQINTKLYIVPFEKIQKELIMKVKAESRMLVYRRFMIKIASKVARNERARFLIVGDSLSQVASQTLENLEATYKDTDMHVLSPLIGLHKKEIIDIAREIETFDISSLPYGDCCSYFLPKHPNLKATSGLLKSFEAEFDIDALVTDALKDVNVVEWK